MDRLTAPEREAVEQDPALREELVGLFEQRERESEKGRLEVEARRLELEAMRDGMVEWRRKYREALQAHIAGL